MIFRSPWWYLESRRWDGRRCLATRHWHRWRPGWRSSRGWTTTRCTTTRRTTTAADHNTRTTRSATATSTAPATATAASKMRMKNRWVNGGVSWKGNCLQSGAMGERDPDRFSTFRASSFQSLQILHRLLPHVFQSPCAAPA